MYISLVCDLVVQRDCAYKWLFNAFKIQTLQKGSIPCYCVFYAIFPVALNIKVSVQFCLFSFRGKLVTITLIHFPRSLCYFATILNQQESTNRHAHWLSESFGWVKHEPRSEPQIISALYIWERGSVSTSRLQGPWFAPELGLLSIEFRMFSVSAWVSSGSSVCPPTSPQKKKVCCTKV